MTVTDDDRLWRDQNLPSVSDEELDKIIHTFSNNEEKSTGSLNAKEVIEEASELIMKQHTFVTVEETGEIWYYKDGVYVPGGDILIAKD